ncbi:MAG: glycosyltransferase family 4 protein [Candidatus Levybacteria bacterium]|nr:glycosyltransferase family 4 protein [Candidatus Levybacteria bacterium]
MKIGLYDPYLDTLGGGERYIFTIASCLQDSHHVMLFWDDKSILDQAKKRFNIRMDNVQLAGNIFSRKVSLLEKLRVSSSFDVIFYISDGSVPSLLSKKVIPIVQFPLKVMSMNSFMTQLKLQNTTTIICYSKFIQEFLKKQFIKPVTVLYPAVDPNPLSLPRENIVLSVGRFTQGNNTKKQDFLIDFFNTHKLHFRGWKLVLIGSVLPEDRDYLKTLRKRVEKNKGIEILENLSYASLVRYYARAKIYLHATGFGEDLTVHPERAEHFGISVVEAMSAGCVPIVFGAGGPAEIVGDSVNGFHFHDTNELFHKIKSLMNDAWLWQKFSDASKKRAGDFSYDSFCKKLQTLL